MVSIHIDLGRFSSAAKVQKEIGELLEAVGDSAGAMDAYQTAADYYQAEESNSTANQMLLKVAGLASMCKDYKRAVEIYEQVLSKQQQQQRQQQQRRRRWRRRRSGRRRRR